MRAHLAGDREPGVRRRAVPDPLERFVPYIAARLGDDPHLWLTTLQDELVPLGWAAGYRSLTRGVRRAGLRQRCEACAGVRGRDTIEIEHPLGAETGEDRNVEHRGGRPDEAALAPVRRDGRGSERASSSSW